MKDAHAFLLASAICGAGGKFIMSIGYGIVAAYLFLKEE